MRGRTDQIIAPELDGRAMTAATAPTTDATPAGDSATPPCAPSPSTSPRSTAASAGACELT